MYDVEEMLGEDDDDDEDMDLDMDDEEDIFDVFEFDKGLEVDDESNMLLLEDDDDKEFVLFDEGLM